jgi:hypothetical protein
VALTFLLVALLLLCLGFLFLFFSALPHTCPRAFLIFVLFFYLIGPVWLASRPLLRVCLLWKSLGGAVRYGVFVAYPILLLCCFLFASGRLSQSRISLSWAVGLLRVSRISLGTNTNQKSGTHFSVYSSGY